MGSFLPLLFGFPEFLRLFPRKLSLRPLSAPRGQRSVLKVAWDDVTTARAQGQLPGDEASSPLHSAPHPPSRVAAPCLLFSPPLSSLGLRALQVGNPGLEFCEGAGHGVWCSGKTLPLCWLREPWVTFSLDWHRRAFPPSAPLPQPPSSLFPFPPAALPSVSLPPPPFELKLPDSSSLRRTVCGMRNSPDTSSALTLVSGTSRTPPTVRKRVKKLY